MRRLVTLFALCLWALCHSATAAAAAPSTDCDDEKLGDAYATASLILDGKHVDDVKWTSTVAISVPTSWTAARHLLKDPSSPEFATVASCVYDEGATTPDITLVNNRVVLTYTVDGTVSTYDDVFLSPSWYASEVRPHFEVRFDLSPGSKVAIPWRSVTVTATGFRLGEPNPLPASFSGSTSRLQWTNLQRSTLDSANLSFTAHPSRSLSIAYYLETGGYGQYIPVDTQALLLWASIMFCLTKRLTSESGSTLDRTRRTLRAISFVLALVALSDITFDISSQTTFPAFDSNWAGIAGFSILACLMTSRAGKWKRALFAVLVLTIATGSLLLHDGVLGWAAGFAALLLSWVVTLWAAITIFSSHRGRMGKPSRGLLISTLLFLVVTTTVALGSVRAYQESTLVDAANVLRQWLPAIATVGVVLVVATRRRQASLILERRDQFLLALVIGAVVFRTGPQWYLGLHVNLASLVAFATTLILLVASQRFIRLRSLHALLRTISPADLRDVQQKLLKADRRVTELNTDLKALEGKPLTTEQAQWRESIREEIEGLHRWPPSDPTPNSAPKRKLLRFRRQNPASVLSIPSGTPLPSRAHPVDVALALGTTDPLRNATRAAIYSLAPAVILGCYFTWKWAFPHDASFTSFYWWDPSFWLLSYLIDEVLFWIAPALLLGVAWSSLVGRRGSSRALFVWLCIALPLGVHIAISQFLQQSSSLVVALRLTLVFFIVFSVGLAFDLRTLAGQRTHESPFKLFQTYMGLNRVLPTLLLVLPLITGGVSLWGQINKGVLEQKSPPAQTEQRSTTSSPTPTPSP